MEEQLSPEKKLTVGSLLLHAIALLTFAAIFLSSYQPLGGSPLSGVSFTPIAYFVVMVVMAIWLSGRHYRTTVRKRNLLIWAALHILGSLYVFCTILYMSSLHTPIPPTDFSRLLLFLFLYIIPPMLIIVFAYRERT